MAIGNTNPIRSTRERLLREFARKAAAEFGITEDGDIKTIEDRIVGSAVLTDPLLVVKRSPKADSALYRDHTRSTYIDLVAYFIQLKFIEESLLRIENASRNTLNAVKSELISVEKSIHPSDQDGYINELFFDSSSAVFNNTIVTNNRLALLPVSNSRGVQTRNISITTYPVASMDVTNSVVGEPNTVTRSGTGSGVWYNTVFTNEIPSVFWGNIESETDSAPISIRGVAALIDIELDAPIILNNISADFLSLSRVVRAYFLNEDNQWSLLRSYDGNFLESDNGRSIELHNILNAQSSQRYRFLIASEVPVNIGQQRLSIPVDMSNSLDKLLAGQLSVPVEADQIFNYQYLIGVYNLKLRQALYPSSGEYISPPYSTDRGFMTSVEVREVKQQAKKQSFFTNFEVQFFANNFTHSLPILPVQVDNTTPAVEEIATVDASGNVRPSFFVQPGTLSFVFVRDFSGVGIPFIYDSTLNILQLSNVVNTTVHIGYKTGINSGIGYEYLTDVGIITRAATPPNDRPYTIRRYAPSSEFNLTIGTHEAAPLLEQSIEEVFSDTTVLDNQLDLRTIPFADYDEYDWTNNTWSGTAPVTVTIKVTSDSDETTATDRTIWSDRKLQPKLREFLPDENNVEYFLYRNTVYLNVVQPYSVTVEYTTMAESARLVAKLNTLNTSSTPIIDEYEVKLNANN